MIEGFLPEGGKDRAIIRVASVVPFLMMKAEALNSRLKEKDAYDIYYCLVNYPGGLDELVNAFCPYLEHSLIVEGLNILAEKFQSPDFIGPTFIADFLGETDPESRALIQQDSFGRINYLLHKLGFKKLSIYHLFFREISSQSMVDRLPWGHDEDGTPRCRDERVISHFWLFWASVPPCAQPHDHSLAP